MPDVDSSRGPRSSCVSSPHAKKRGVLGSGSPLRRPIIRHACRHARPGRYRSPPKSRGSVLEVAAKSRGPPKTFDSKPAPGSVKPYLYALSAPHRHKTNRISKLDSPTPDFLVDSTVRSPPKSRASVLEVAAKSRGPAEDIRFETSPQQRKALSFLTDFRLHRHKTNRISRLDSPPPTFWWTRAAAVTKPAVDSDSQPVE
jgi:hypothetical protein